MPQFSRATLAEPSDLAFKQPRPPIHQRRLDNVLWTDNELPHDRQTAGGWPAPDVTQR